MADDWRPEHIPDSDQLFMRAHRTHFRDDELLPGVFRDQGPGMSTSWEKYRTCKQARLSAKKPEDNAIISLGAQSTRGIPLEVQHTPDVERQDRSHTDVSGEKTPEVRLKLLSIFRWCIRLGDPVDRDP